MDCSKRQQGRIGIDEASVCVRVLMCCVYSTVEAHLGPPKLAALAVSNEMGVMLSVLGQ